MIQLWRWRAVFRSIARAPASPSPASLLVAPSLPLTSLSFPHHSASLYTCMIPPGIPSHAASQQFLVQQRRGYALKAKKYKIKAFSSYKMRFREKANGEYKRWKAGKRHNAHSKTNKQLRQLRRPSVVPLAYAKIMKKLNFHG
eukprot:c19771_g1_i2 orf=578-1006(-)